MVARLSGLEVPVARSSRLWIACLNSAQRLETEVEM